MAFYFYIFRARLDKAGLLGKLGYVVTHRLGPRHLLNVRESDMNFPLPNPVGTQIWVVGASPAVSERGKRNFYRVGLLSVWSYAAPAG